jgi:glucose-6-phosphate 1-dehydrogenase
MNNRLKEFEELLLNNTLFKVQNQALGDSKPKWKEWWQIVQEFKDEWIHDNMELAHFDEQSYKPTKLFSLISSTNHQILCLWKLELVVEFQ